VVRAPGGIIRRCYTYDTKPYRYDAGRTAFSEIGRGFRWEIGRGFRWNASTWVVMLWVYFDESGEHDANGHLTKLTLGGSIASSEVWDIVSVKWERVLKDFAIDMFHMADFEANRGEFKGWERTQERRKRLLNALLDICCEHLHFHVGLIARHPESERFTNTYKINIVDSIAMVRSRIVSTDGSPFALVYAKHPEFSFSKLEKAFYNIGQNDPRVRTCATLDPIDAPPLQVADIVAYEISRKHRVITYPRYPWDRLASNAGILIFRDDAPTPSSEGQP
jgi:hypothetical protein